MYALWFVRKDNRNVRKFEGHYLTKASLDQRVDTIHTRKLVSDSWDLVVEERRP